MENAESRVPPDLRSAPASDVKKKGWRRMLELAREHQGRLAITSHNRPQAVILTVEAYEQLVEQSRRQEAAFDSTLEALSAEFDQRLATLGTPAGTDRLRKAARAPARLHGKVKAGTGH
jgi:prevent-host-death family protein